MNEVEKSTHGKITRDRKTKRNTFIKENSWNSKTVSMGTKIRGWILELLHRQSIGFSY